MSVVNEGSAEGNEGGQVPRRHFLISLLAAGLWRPRAAMGQLQSKRQDSHLPVRVSTLNHVSFGCADLRSTVQWYGRVFGMPVHAFQDYGGGQTVVRIGAGPAYIALSQRNPESIGRPPSRLPHFCWGVEDFNVDRILNEGPPIAILRVGSGSQFVALVEGSGPPAFRPHVGFGVQGFAPDQIMKRLAKHGVRARTRLREGATVEILVDAPDGVEIQLQDVSYCGGGGLLGNMCG